MNRSQAIAAGIDVYIGKFCSKCGTCTKRVSDYNCVQCSRERSKSQQQVYRKTPKGKEVRQKYEKGQAGKATRARYNKTKVVAGDRWKYSILTKYGINEEQYFEMLAAQHHQCKICGKPVDQNGKRFAVDHCHTTGKIRSLLCHNCNVGLGNFNDNIEIMMKAIEYLKDNT